MTDIKPGRRLGNTEKFIGILINGGHFDQWMLAQARLYIRSTAQRLGAEHGVLTKKMLIDELGFQRNRLPRILEALKIKEEIFGLCK